MYIQVSQLYILSDKPVCSPNIKRIYEANKLQTLNMDCKMMSNPMEGLVFSWSFNNSINTMDIPVS